jgi:hypothetical protein
MWNVSSVQSIEGMFCGAEAFNHDVSSWDGSWVIRMPEMFGVGSIQQFGVIPNACRRDVDVDVYFDDYFDDYYVDPYRDTDGGWNDCDDECLRDQFSD